MSIFTYNMFTNRGSFYADNINMEGTILALNFGIISAGNIQPAFAYSPVRSSILPFDAVILSILGGLCASNPAMGAAVGATMAVTDRIFCPAINNILPG